MSSAIDISLKLLVLTAFIVVVSAGNFNTDTKITWGDGRGKILDGGRTLTLSLDMFSGSGFESIKGFIYGRFDMKLKLIPGDSAGTVTTFFLTSPEGPMHDEIDFEFLGNASGQPYTVHTNIFAQGKGSKEQQFHLWFDPRDQYHLYSIVWNSERVIWLVDNIPIRVHKNNEAIGVPFPKTKDMKIQCSLWNADDWATQGGRVKTNWTLAPFTASYKDVNFNGNACIPQPANSTMQPICAPTNPSDNAWQTLAIDANGKKRLKWVNQKFLIYNYCTDTKRFPLGVPPECKVPAY